MTTQVEFQPGEIATYYRARAPKIKQNGGQWRGPCPLHEGKNDSFAINPETGTWFCHSKCARGGSLIDFEMELGGKSFAEAGLARRGGVLRESCTTGRRLRQSLNLQACIESDRPLRLRWSANRSEG